MAEGVRVLSGRVVYSFIIWISSPCRLSFPKHSSSCCMLSTDFFSLWNASIDISYCSLREHSNLEYCISFHARFSWTALYGSCPIYRLIPSRNFFIRIIIINHGSYRVDWSMDFIFINNWFLSNATKIDLLAFSRISLLLYNSLIISVTLRPVWIAKDVFQLLSKFYRQMLRIPWITRLRTRGGFRANGT